MDVRGEQRGMSLLDWGLTARELKHARNVLQDDEPVVLVLRPQEAPAGELRWMTLCFLCIFVLVAAHLQLEGEHPLSFLTGVLLCMPGVCIMANRWRKLYSRRHTFYMLTRQRALVMEGTLRGYKPCSYPLHADMVEAVAVRGDGSGNIVFCERKGWYIDDSRVIDEVHQLGFMDIPQVKYVQRVLEQTIKERENVGE
jgi:hypothetical protein